MALQMKTHHAASTAYRVCATCGIHKVLSSVLGYRLHFFPHVVASRQVEMISAFHLELDLFQFASEILDNFLRHDFIKKIKPIISPCFFVGNLRSYINPHALTSPSQLKYDSIWRSKASRPFRLRMTPLSPQFRGVPMSFSRIYPLVN